MGKALETSPTARATYASSWPRGWGKCADGLELVPRGGAGRLFRSVFPSQQPVGKRLRKAFYQPQENLSW